MKITSSLLPKLGLRKKGQVSRRDRYRSEVKVTPQDKADHLAINWRPDQTPSQLISKNGSEYTVSNFRWGFKEAEGNPDDWAVDNGTTKIDASKVKEVYLAIEPFAPEIVAGHGLMVFEMEEDGAIEGPDGRKDFGFAVSVEARKRVGDEYGLAKGMKKNFGMIYQLGSLSDQVQKVTRQRNHKLILNRLVLNDDQKQELIHDALDASVEDRLGEWYHTLTNSCYTASVDLINDVVPKKQKMVRWTDHLRFSRLSTTLPALGGATLRSHSLLAKEPITYLKPDPELYPDNQKEAGAITKVVAKASRSALFKPTFAIAGAGAVGALGYAIGGMFGEIGGYAGAAIGGLSGLGTGAYLADVTAVKTDQKPINAVEWYSQRGGVSVDEAKQRVSNSAHNA
jgi:hypothetical protein